MQPDFHALLLEGMFYLDPDGVLLVKPATGPVVDVRKALDAFEGLEVQLSAHHVPMNPPDLSRWGGGSCMWQNHGTCPFGHHLDPMRLGNVVIKGTFEHVSGYTWKVSTFEGGDSSVDLKTLLEGHKGRIAAATVFDAQKMLDALSKDPTAAMDVGALGQRATDLRDLLQQIKKIAGDE